MATRKLTAAQVGVVHGFRSGLEEQVSQQLTRAGIPFDYEGIKLRYIKPARESKYTPDFALPNGIIVETKGRFLVEDRHKHLLLKSQHPNLDVRFVFSNSNARISKNSKTTYAAWCAKYGFTYADKFIPKGWLEEAPDPARIAAIKEAQA